MIGEFYERGSQEKVFTHDWRRVIHAASSPSLTFSEERFSAVSRTMLMWAATTSQVSFDVHKQNCG